MNSVDARSRAGDTFRIEAVGPPWWAAAPAVLLTCLRIAATPIQWLVLAAEALVSLSFVGFGIVIWLWWIGYIPDERVVSLLTSVGDRLLALTRSVGLP